MGVHSNELLHRLLHLVAFGCLAWLAMAAFPGHRSLILVIPSCILFGGMLELLQTSGSHMPMEWNDVYDDAIGIVMTAAFRRPRQYS
jgi:hypothetical protein